MTRSLVLLYALDSLGVESRQDLDNRDKIWSLKCWLIWTTWHMCQPNISLKLEVA